MDHLRFFAGLELLKFTAELQTWRTYKQTGSVCVDLTKEEQLVGFKFLLSEQQDEKNFSVSVSSCSSAGHRLWDQVSGNQREVQHQRGGGESGSWFRYQFTSVGEAS